MPRLFAAALASIMLMSTTPSFAEQKSGTIEVFKSASCGCCNGWVKHLKQSGYTVNATNTAAGILAKIKRDAGLKPDLQSCHTGKVAGYVIEGHVPAQDVARLLAEKPDAVGLTVPGMPLGSPGMDTGPDKEPYEVLLVKKDGSTEVFARHQQDAR